MSVRSDDFAKTIFKRHVDQSIGFKSSDCERAAKIMLTRKNIFKITTQDKRRFLICS